MPKRKVNYGNGAFEALTKYFSGPEPRIADVSHLLAWLWTEGFIVKPLSKKDVRKGIHRL